MRILSTISIVLFFCFNSYSQHVILAEECLTQNEFDDRYASYSPNGQQILFESNRDGNWELYLMNLDGTNQQRLTQNEANDRRPSWHPEGEVILFESDRSGKVELYTLSLKKMKPKKLAELDFGEPIFASFSPDGEMIATTVKETEDKSNIILLDKKGRLVRTLTNTNYRSAFPRWSNDGKELIYFSRKETMNEDDEIYKVEVKTRAELRLTNWPGNNFCPSWSPDNSKIAYVTSFVDGRPEIYLMDADGDNQIQITFNEEGETLPCWSPDSRKLLLTAFRNGHYQICELSLEVESKE